MKCTSLPLLRRREFITLLGGAAAAWPLAARAQQPAMPVIGFLDGASPEPYAHVVAAFRKGLSETGYVEGQNVAIEYRWAEGRYRSAAGTGGRSGPPSGAVIVAPRHRPRRLRPRRRPRRSRSSSSSADDPVRLGLVASLNRPGGNVTGVTFFSSGTSGEAAGAAARVGARKRQRIAVLVESDQCSMLQSQLEQTCRTRHASLGLTASCPQCQHRSEIDAAFALPWPASAPTRLSLRPMLSSPAGAIKSPHWRPATRCRDLSVRASMPRPAA